jgi:hypothetical protein
MKQIRLALTLTPELDEVITHIAQFQKTPKTTVITGLLTEMLPALQGISDAYKMVEKKENPAIAMNHLVVMMMKKIGEFGEEIDDHNKSQMKKCPDTIEMDLKTE